MTLVYSAVALALSGERLQPASDPLCPRAQSTLPLGVRQAFASTCGLRTCTVEARAWCCCKAMAWGAVPGAMGVGAGGCISAASRTNAAVTREDVWLLPIFNEQLRLFHLCAAVAGLLCIQAGGARQVRYGMRVWAEQMRVAQLIAVGRILGCAWYTVDCEHLHCCNHGMQCVPYLSAGPYWALGWPIVLAFALHTSLQLGSCHQGNWLPP